MDEDSFKFEIKVEVELKDGHLNTRIYAPDEELSKEAYQVQRAYMMVIGQATRERRCQLCGQTLPTKGGEE